MFINKKINIHGVVIAGIILAFAFCKFSVIDVSAYTNTPKKVDVKTANFNIKINGVKIDNKYSKYPFIVYNNITYMPLTYDYCEFMGVKAEWNPNKPAFFVGLKEESTEESSKLLQNQKGYIKNTVYNKATVVNYAVGINSYYAFFNDDKLKYPFLNFRNITYFPLTWEYTADAFGWDYKYSNVQGFDINSDGLLKTLIFPVPSGHVLNTLPIGGLHLKDQVHSSEVGVLYPIDIQYFDKRELNVKWKDGRMQTFDISGELPEGITYFERRTSKIMKPEIVENMFKIVASVAPQNQPEYKCMLTFDLNSGKVIDKKII